MNRRGFLSVITAGAGASAISSVAARAARDIDRSSGRGQVSVQRADWVPHTTIDVARDGRATVTVSLEGEEAPEKYRLNRQFSKDVEITRGEDALQREDSTFLWDSTIADEIEYTVQLGHLNQGSSTWGVFENCIVANTQELLLMISWIGTLEAMPQTHRFTIEPPSGWSAEMGGTKVEEYTFESERRLLYPSQPWDMIVVGDVSSHSRSVDDTAVRVVSMPGANGPEVEAILDEYEDTLPGFEKYFDHDTSYEKLCAIVTDDVEPGYGGQAFAQSCLVSEVVELVADHDTYLQELAALYSRTVVPGWIKNGFRSYIQRVILWEAGLISEEKLYDDVQGYGSDGGEAIREPVSAREFDKGAALCAALDMDIRARTDGEATIADWRGALNDRENEYIPEGAGGENRGVSRDTSLTLLEDITGVSYADFYDRYVDGSEYPTAVLSDDFSLTNPITVKMATLEVRSVEGPATTEIRAGEEIEVTVDVANTGDSSNSRTFELRVDDEVVASSEVALDPGESQTVTLRHVFENVGQYALKGPGEFEQQITVSPRTASFEYRSIDVSTTELYRGEELELTIEVANTGGASDSDTVELRVDDEVVASREVTLEPSESETVTLRHVFEQRGRHTIQLPDESERQIVVLRPYEKESVELSDTELEVGDSVRVMVDVSNLADVPTAVEFTLEVVGGSDGPSRESKTIELAVGETAEVTFLHTFEESGEFDIFLDERHVSVVNVEQTDDETVTTDGQADDETVTTDGQADDETTTADGPGFGIVSGVASIGGAAYLLARRVPKRGSGDR